MLRSSLKYGVHRCAPLAPTKDNYLSCARRGRKRAVLLDQVVFGEDGSLAEGVYPATPSADLAAAGVAGWYVTRPRRLTALQYAPGSGVAPASLTDKRCWAGARHLLGPWVVLSRKVEYSHSIQAQALLPICLVGFTGSISSLLIYPANPGSARAAECVDSNQRSA